MKKIKVPSTHSLLSLDIVSTFDKIPLDLALDCIEKKLILNHNLTEITKSEYLITTIRTLLNNMVFSFIGKYYKQLSYCPMGSSLSPIVSNLVSEDVEKRVWEKLNFMPIL